MRILITGSSGQIGTNLALALLRMGHEVAGIDVRANPWTGGFPSLIHDLTAGFPAEDALPGPWRSPDVVAHLAAHAKVHDLVLHPQRALENMQMTFHVLERCRERGVPLVFAGSREVYGNVRRDRTSEDDVRVALAESPYAASKVSGEAMVHAYARSYSLPFLIFRLSNVYGRYDNDLDRLERVIPLWMDRIGRSEPITVYGPEKVLDFTYIDDCVDGLVRGIEALWRGRLCGETMNLAYGEGHTLLEVARLVGAALGKEPRMILAPRRSGEITRYVANLDRARTLLGYAPKVPLEEGIGRAETWSREWAARLRADRKSPGPIAMAEGG